MPRSRTNPADTYPYFSTSESIHSVAGKLGILRRTLRSWWIKEFGLEAYTKRIEVLKPQKISQEERDLRRKLYRENNKDSIRDAKRKWREDNPDKVRATRKRYRETNKDKIRSNWNEYYSKNSKVITGQARSRRLADLETYRERDRKRAKDNPELTMWKSAKLRAAKLDLPFDITVEDIKECTPKNQRCPITGVTFKRNEGNGGPESRSLDRRVPDLGYVKGNIAVISHLANTLKGSCTDPEVFRRIARYLEGDQKLTFKKVS